MSRFEPVEFDATAIGKSKYLRMHFEAIEKYAMDRLVISRERFVAFTILEDAHMWMNKAIAEDQLSRTED